MAKKENENKQKNSYFKGMKQELKKVVWPTPKELVNNTIAVIAFVIIIGAIVFVLDLCFDNLSKYGITKFQEKVQSSFRVDNGSENNEETENSEDVVENEESIDLDEETEGEGEVNTSDVLENNSEVEVTTETKNEEESN